MTAVLIFAKPPDRTGVFIGRQRADLGRNRFAHEAAHIDRRRRAENARHNVALALDHADDGRLANQACLYRVSLLLLVAFLSADRCFVHLDNAHKLAKVLVLQSRADAMANVPGRVVREPEAHDAAAPA